MTTPIKTQLYLSNELKDILQKGAEVHQVPVGDYLAWLLEAVLREEAEYYGWSTPPKNLDTDYAKKIQATIKRVYPRERKKSKSSRL